MITTVVDVVFITSIILFITGFLAVVIRPIRRGLQAIHKKFRIRHLFIGSLICFILALAIGWEDAVKAFYEGVHEARYGVSNTEGAEGEP